MKFYEFFGKDPSSDQNGITIVVWGYDAAIAEEEANEHLAENGLNEVQLTLVDERDSSRSSIVYSDAEKR